MIAKQLDIKKKPLSFNVETIARNFYVYTDLFS